LQAKLTGREEQALQLNRQTIRTPYDAHLRGLAFEAGSIYPSDALRKAVSLWLRGRCSLTPSLRWLGATFVPTRFFFTLADYHCRAPGWVRSECAKLQPTRPKPCSPSVGYYCAA
jgi:hypothetical protein